MLCCAELTQSSKYSEMHRSRNETRAVSGSWKQAVSVVMYVTVCVQSLKTGLCVKRGGETTRLYYLPRARPVLIWGLL